LGAADVEAERKPGQGAAVGQTLCPRNRSGDLVARPSQKPEGIEVNAISADGEILIAIPVLLVGGTELHTLALARALQSTGARVRVCCYYEHAPAMVRAFEKSGVEVTLLRLERAAGLWHLFRVLYRFFKQARPSVVHVQYVAPGLMPVTAAWAAGICTIFATVHQSGDRFGVRERMFFSVAARLCLAFFCVSRAVEDSWFGSSAVFSVESAAQGRRHFTIYNGVDTVASNDTSLAAASGELKANLGLAGRRIVGVVGRLRVEKGHALLLNALPLVLKAVPDATLLVVGDGPDREVLLAQARALGVMPRIVWTGERSPEDVLALYGLMDVVAVPSRFEGFGLSAAEAMAAGRPVVGTRVGGLCELIEDGVTGYLISPEDSTAFAAALIRVLRDPRDATIMGVRGHLRVSEKFSTERFAEAFVTAYRYFMKGGKCTGGATGRLPLVP